MSVILKTISRAHQEKWALGEFNMSNLEVLQGIVDAGDELNSPVLIGVSMGSLNHIGLHYLRGLIQAAHSQANVPVYFHLDHGNHLDAIQNAVEIGFDSVMLDASNLPFEENISRVCQVVDFAHKHNVVVEAQVGEAGDEEKGITKEEFTRPEQVTEFIKRTGIDLLAFSFGSKPGRWSGDSAPSIEIVREVAAKSSVPLVLHGASTIPDDFIRQAIGLGAAKINIDAHLRKAASQTLEKIYSQPQIPHDPRVAFREIRSAVKEAVKQKMVLFGSVNKA